MVVEGIPTSTDFKPNAMLCMDVTCGKLYRLVDNVPTEMFQHDHSALYYLKSAVDSLLTGKSDTSHEHDYAAIDHTHDYAAVDHNHDSSYYTESEVDTALSGKASTAHDHDESYSAISHGHAISDVTGLQTELDGKSATGHNHDGSYSALGHNHSGVYEPANANIQTHIGSAHAPSNAQKNSDITKAEIEAKLTGTITSHSHSGGSDPWTVVALGNDFSTTSNTAQNVTGINFTPIANTRYMFECMLMTRTATATVGPRPGISWPTGMTDGVVNIQTTSSATAVVMANGNTSAAVLGPVGGLPNNTQSYPAFLFGMVVAGASPSGNVQLQLASETNGTSVTIKAGSFLRYRTY